MNGKKRRQKAKANKPTVAMTLRELVSGLRAFGWIDPQGPRVNDFDPQAHFTDTLDNPHTPTVKAVLDKYGPQVKLWFAYSPFGGNSYSIELQFADEDVAAKCIAEYAAIPTGCDDDDEDE